MQRSRGRRGSAPGRTNGPGDWLRHVNRPLQEADALAVRQCIARGTRWEEKREGADCGAVGAAHHVAAAREAAE